MRTLPLHLLALAGALLAAAASAGPAEDLAAVHAASSERLRSSPFGRPLWIESAEGERSLKGEVFAEIAHPFARVRDALAAPANWCELLLLHPNMAHCRAAPDSGKLAVTFARRLQQGRDAGYPAELEFHGEQASADYLRVRLAAERGPVGTGDYLIVVEAMPVAAERTFLHFSYSYSYGFTARLATQAYLATKGSEKIGFTVTGTGPGGEPQYIGGLRGAIERNAMRYYLAIDAFLGALAAPPAERFERSLARWLDFIEQYPRQLQEDDREVYERVKRGQHEELAARE